MTQNDPHWKAALLLQLGYFLLLGAVFLVYVELAYNSVPAQAVLSLLDWTLLLIPAASVAATALRSRWDVRRWVLIAPYAWAAGVGLLWACTMLFV